jgi:hypothetical protein
VGRIMLRSFGFRHSARAGGLSTSAIFFDCRPHTRLLCFLGSGLALLWVSPYFDLSSLHFGGPAQDYLLAGARRAS